MANLCAIGDPHGDFEKIKKVSKKADFYLVTGDFGKADLARKFAFENVRRRKEGLPEIKEDVKSEKAVRREIYDSSMKILRYLSGYAPVYTIRGNVGSTGAETRKAERKFNTKFPQLIAGIKRLKNVHYVKNRVRRIGGLRIGFLEYFTDTSWVREFKPSNYEKSLKAARKQTEKAKRILKNFGKTDILVCHQPPYGYLDRVNAKFAPKHWRGKHAGSKAILDYVKKFQPRYVFCGHIHEGKGKRRIGKSEVYNLGAGMDILVDVKP